MPIMSKMLSLGSYPSFDLITPLPQDECVRRLRNSTDPWRAAWSTYVMGIRIAGSESNVNPKAVVARISESNFLLIKRIEDFNSFQTCLFAYLHREPHQTRLHCFVGIHPSVVAVGASMFLVLCWITGGLISQGDEAVSTIDLFGWMYMAHGPWIPAAGFLFFFAFGAFLAVSGCYLARGERAFLLDFLRDTIDARKV